MYPWERGANRSAASPELDESAVLTQEEIAQLAKMRARYQSHPQCVEFDLDESRLDFARWRVEHGWLREDL